jgi:hypothetical protein
MSQTNDNFDNLWASLKDSIREQRGERKSIYTFGETVLTEQHGGRLSVSKVDTHEGKGMASVHVGRGSFSGLVNVHREDLMALAAQCLGAVADMDEQSNTTKP